jgi:intracellular sulfur oxidation DsrE/DsrF family protein
MRLYKKITLAIGLLALVHSAPVWAADPPVQSGLHIDIPVQLKASNVVFNMDHPTFAGDQSIGLMHMGLMVKNYKASQTPLHIIAVYHGMAGFMLLNDATYDKVRKTERGNPYREAIAALQKEGVEFEECGQTARVNGWVNSDLLPAVKVNTGANLRIVQLVQDGFVQLQP